MICIGCGADNREDAKFCHGCGSKFRTTCASCSAELRPEAKFCDNCGTQVGAAANAATPPAAPSAGAASGADQPDAFADGRYVTRRLLGEGGKKKVYLAADTLLDRQVAIAVLKSGSGDEPSRDRLKREAQAMGRIGDHPNVLPIYDYGADDEDPYLVLPYMSGGDVESLLARSPDTRLSIEEAIRIARQVCGALGFAHSKGIVHRDLKPGNVWLSEDGAAKVGDFGLALVQDQTRLTQDGAMVGTVTYMPPEQAVGGQATSRSDLYSLGVMLYEMVTGRPPYSGDGPAAVIAQHLNATPLAPSWHVPAAGGPVEDLILGLLQKDPERRPSDAQAVSDALARIATGDRSVSTEGMPIAAASSAGPFVGRDSEMADLIGALDASFSGRGGMVMLSGDIGSGKTRTAEELVTRARQRGGSVLHGRCQETRGAPSYWPWLQAIRTHVRSASPEDLTRQLGAGAPDVAEMVSEIRHRIPGLSETPKLDDPEQARFRLFDSVVNFLVSASQQSPITLVLDDLQWADRPSLLLLEFLTHSIDRSRLLVIGTYRDSDVAGSHPLVETLAELGRQPFFSRIALKGLNEKSVQELIEQIAGVEPPASLVRAIQANAEGNPLYVTEVVGMLAEQGQLATGAAGRAATKESWDLRVPEGVRGVVGRRLRQLSEGSIAALSLAAVVGRSFTARQLDALGDGGASESLLALMEEAITARVITADPLTAGTYEFSNSLIHRTLYDETPAPRRAALHAAIGRLIEQAAVSDPGSKAAEVAAHYERAGEHIPPEKLATTIRLAAGHAMGSYAYEEALALLQRGAELAPRLGQGRECGLLRWDLAKAQAAVQQKRAAIATLSLAVDDFASIGDTETAVQVALTSVPHLPGQVSGAGDLLHKVLGLVPDDSLQSAEILSALVPVSGIDEADYAGALAAMDQAMAVADREDDRSLQLRTLARACGVHAYHLKFGECLDAGLRVIELAREMDDPRSAAASHFYVAMALWSTGEAAKSQQHAAKSLELAEGLRDRFWTASALWAVEIVNRLQGRFQAAIDSNERGLQLSPRDPRLLGTRALMEFELGEVVAGRGHVERLVELEEATSDGRAFERAFTASVIPSITLVSGISDWLPAAEKAGTAMMNTPGVAPLVAIRAHTGQAWVAVIKQDPELAGRIYDLLEPRNGSMTPGGMWSIDHLLGLMADVRGDQDAALKHLKDAVAFCRDAGYKPEQATASRDLARLLTESGSDTARAFELYGQSVELARELGMRPLVESAMRGRMKAQGIEDVSLRTSIESVMSAVQQERPDVQRLAAADGTLTILFTDIVGSTSITERLGDQMAQELIRTHNDIVRRNVGSAGGYEVKSMGDGFMIVFPAALQGVTCAAAIQDELASHNAGARPIAEEGAGPIGEPISGSNSEPISEPIKVRMGLHMGEAIAEEGDFFGKSVILASRIAESAGGDQILVSSEIVNALKSETAFTFASSGSARLSGLSDEYELFEVGPSSDLSTAPGPG
jgi:eukaryotic-like serine/threonine-protein kinase